MPICGQVASLEHYIGFQGPGRVGPGPRSRAIWAEAACGSDRAQSRIGRVDSDFLGVSTYAQRIPGLCRVMNSVCGGVVRVEGGLVLVRITGRHDDQTRVGSLPQYVGCELINCG